MNTDGRLVNTGGWFVKIGGRFVNTGGRFVKTGGGWRAGAGWTVPGNARSCATGSGITGTGFGGAGGGGLGRTGMDSAWLSCIRSMVGGAGLDVCADRFKTTSMPIMARDSSVRMILFFMYVSMWLHLTAVNLCRHPAFEFKLCAGPAVGYGV